MSVLQSVRSKVAAARKALATASGSVADIRDAVARLQDARRAVEAAPIPTEEAGLLIGQTVDRLLAGLTQYTSVDDVVAAAAHGRTVDMRALSLEQRVQLLVVGLKPILHERFRQALEEHYRTVEPGLPRDARAARLREIDAELSQLEREEETLISELAEAGVTVDRRADVSPAIILGLES